jgi:HK97 family phage portal protein
MGILRNLYKGIEQRTAQWAVTKSTQTYKLTNPMLWKIFKQDDQSTLTDPYSQLAAVYACVNAKARNIASVPFDIYKIGSEKPLESGTIVDLFKRPNPWMSNTQLFEAIIISLETCGEWHCAKDKEVGRDGVPAFLWVWNPDSMQTAKASNGAIVGWWHTVGVKKDFVANDQILFDKYWNPKDPVRGLAPLRAYRLTAESGYDGLRYNRNFFKNDATPPVVFKFPEMLSDPEFKAEQERLINRRRGVEHAHEAMIMDGGASVEKLGITQRDMEFLGQIKNVRDEACMVYQVPKSVISLYEDTNYATAQSADLSFWIRSLCPIMTRVEDKFNVDLLAPLGFTGKFNLRKVDAINGAILQKIDAVVKLFPVGFTRNELNKRFDLGFEEVEWGDEPGRAAAPALPAPPAAPPEVPAPPPPRSVTGETVITHSPQVREIEDAAEKSARARVWNELNLRIMPVASGCNRDLRNYFADVESKLFRKLLKGYKDPLGAPATLKKLEPISEEDIATLFNDDKMKRLLSKWIELSLGTGANTVVGGVFDVASEEALASIAAHVSKVTAINENARQKLIDTIRETFKITTEQGLSEIDAAELLVKSCKADMLELSSHARTIARTEVHGAYSEARDKSMASTGPTGKKWISARDSRVRDSHAYLDGKVVPFDEAFSNGCMFPLDPAGEAAEVINCRCIHVPVYEGEKQ